MSCKKYPNLPLKSFVYIFFPHNISPAYSDLHRGTLQLLMNHSSMNIQDLQKSFDKIIQIGELISIVLKISSKHAIPHTKTSLA